ncbi:MAG: hypothetical protein KAT29_03030 [Anaerolineales bacterium]|nr:hypothetical protein [Anaerolineales bacterium]
MTGSKREKQYHETSWQAAITALVIVLIFISLSLVLNACLPMGTPIPFPSETPVLTSTLTPTETIVWFPATATPTPFSTPVVTATEILKPEIGEIIFSDDFSSADRWALGTSDAGGAALGRNELTIAISKPGTYIFTLRNEPILRDFYAEITASPTLCRALDEYGLLFRWGSMGDFYRYSLSCDGQVRLDRLTGGTAASPQPWMATGVVPPGAPKLTRLAVWVNGNEMMFFVDDNHQFTLSDPMLSSGLLGLFARSAGDNAVTVNFSDLVVHEVRK